MMLLCLRCAVFPVKMGNLWKILVHVAWNEKHEHELCEKGKIIFCVNVKLKIEEEVRRRKKDRPRKMIGKTEIVFYHVIVCTEL